VLHPNITRPLAAGGAAITLIPDVRHIKKMGLTPSRKPSRKPSGSRDAQLFT
jgi:hypothetical protein